MAKVNGPLMSLSASGSVANTLVFSIWKGRPYVRQLVTPANPSSLGQISARLIVGSIAKACRAVLTQKNDSAGVGSPFYIAARDQAPSGQSWISFIQKYAKDIFDKTIAQWALIDSTERGYFTTEAQLLGLQDYKPVLGRVEQVGLTAGQQLMALAFFDRDYLGSAVGNILSEDPSQADVQDFGERVGATNS
jgi:hypothetical protein